MKKTTTRTLLATVLSGLCALSATAEDQAGMQSRELNIPAQSMRDALTAFGRQTGLQVVYKAAEVSDGLIAPPVVGAFTAQDALKRMLSQSGLRYEYLDERTVAIHVVETVSGNNRDSDSGVYVPLLRLAQTNTLSSTEEMAANDGVSSENAQAGAGVDSTRLEEIIVTARKVAERLQDVPMSVTAISGKQLEEAGAVDIKDVLGSIPGLSFSNVERGLTRYNIRGVTGLAGAPTIAVYVDDISMLAGEGAFQGAFDAVMFDLDRLEVLKGPQGTLYGGSTMGGAIKYVSARPNLSARSGKVAIGSGMTAHGDASYNAEGILNLPLIPEVLAVRGGVSYRHEGGYIDNVAGLNIENTARSSTPFPTYTPLIQPSLSTRNREDYNSSDLYVGRLSLLWQPDPSWSIRPAAIYQDYKLANAAFFSTIGDELTSSFRVPQSTRDRGGIYSLEITKAWGGVELTSLTGYVTRTTNWYRDFSFVVGNLVPPLYPFSSEALYSSETKTFSQELRIASAKGSDARLSWVGGLYFRNQDYHFPSSAYVYGGGPTWQAIGVPAAWFPGGVYGDTAYTTDSKSTRDDYAVFGEATYRITDALDVTAGLRAFRIKASSFSASHGPFNGGFSSLRSALDEQGVNPKIGLSYKLDADHMLYTSAAKGFRPGGAITDVYPSPRCDADLARLGYSSAPKKFESDNLWTYELGSKNQFGDRRWVMNGTLFYTDWKDIQQNFSLPNCGRNIQANAGRARIRGVELETQINLTPGLQIGGNTTFNDAKIVDPGFGSGARKDDEILSVPKWMASAYGSYSIPVNATWNLQLRANYQYRSRQRSTFVRSQAVTFSNGASGLVPWLQFTEAYDVVNASASLDRGATSVRMYVNNALDARPILDTDLSSGSSKANTIRPRTIGLEVRQQF